MRGLAATGDRVHAGADSAARAGGRSTATWCCPRCAGRACSSPRASRRGAAAAARQFLLIPGRRGRAATGAVAAALAHRPAPAAGPRSRLAVSVAPDVGDAELPDLVLRHHLAAVLGAGDVELAVRVGATRPNGKPVVQVSGAGRSRARIRQGRLERSHRAAGRRRGRWRCAASPPAADAPRTFRVARLLHAGEWQGNTLAVVEPLVGGAPVTAPEPPRDATHELALGGGVTRGRSPRATGGPGLLRRIDAAGGDLEHAPPRPSRPRRRP